VWRGHEVPPILLSGDHAAIARWRRDTALRKTAANRPDLASRLASGRFEGSSGTGQTATAALDARDLQVLSEAGFPVSGEGVAH
jgi:tRNA (guanine37-N1)-methyltransferase